MSRSQDAAQKAVAKVAAKKVKRLALANALKKIASLKRQFNVKSARADHFEARWLEEKKLRYAALCEKHRVVYEYTVSVTQVEHDKMVKSAKAALQKVIGGRKKKEVLNNNMHKTLMYWKACKKEMGRRRTR